MHSLLSGFSLHFAERGDSKKVQSVSQNYSGWKWFDGAYLSLATGFQTETGTFANTYLQ
jgi:hypothetical protein